MNERAQEFLDLYRQLEELLAVRYRRPDKRYASVIMRFMEDPAGGARFREEINLFREIRNLLSHHAKMDGQDVIEPSEAVVASLRSIVAWVEHPPVAMRMATPYERMQCAHEGESVAEVIRRMEKFGYSHIPVLKKRVLTGVFSAGALLAAVRAGNIDRGATVTIGDIAEYLHIDRHPHETYIFVAKNEGYERIRDAFAASAPNRKRVVAAFVTADGRAEGRVLGMITPWDVIRVQHDE